jgi:Rps23 Pro-64 3,4-dihydroxylase Tpa1-like proline 4-hydroxylase
MDLQRFKTETLRKEFLEAKPFNYLVIDNFFSEPYLNTILTEIENYPQELWYDKNNASINNERDTIFQSKKIALTDYNKMGFLAKTFINFTSSSDFIKFLSDITGINDLESDPHLYGGGIHKVANGGRLSIHSDFNIHPILNKFRRLNVLLYLNKDWQPSCNGQLELWNKDMTQCVTSIAPIFNRLVIFRITDDAFHGHPEPWNHHIETPRYSFALYYYTQERPEEEKAPFHWALWQQRPNIGY